MAGVLMGSLKTTSKKAGTLKQLTDSNIQPDTLSGWVSPSSMCHLFTGLEGTDKARHGGVMPLRTLAFDMRVIPVGTLSQRKPLFLVSPNCKNNPSLVSLCFSRCCDIDYERLVHMKYTSVKPLIHAQQVMTQCLRDDGSCCLQVAPQCHPFGFVFVFVCLCVCVFLMFVLLCIIFCVCVFLHPFRGCFVREANRKAYPFGASQRTNNIDIPCPHTHNLFQKTRNANVLRSTELLTAGTAARSQVMLWSGKEMATRWQHPEKMNWPGGICSLCVCAFFLRNPFGWIEQFLFVLFFYEGTLWLD